MGFKVTESKSASKIDWDYVNSQIPEDQFPARISLIEMGEQERGAKVYFGDDNKTVFKSEDDADTALEQAQELDSYNEKKFKVKENDEGEWEANFRIVNPAPTTEVEVILDFPTLLVEYIEDDEDSIRPYRHYMKGYDFASQTPAGFPLKANYETKTLDSRSTLYKLAKSAGLKNIIDPNSDENMEIDQLANQVVNIDIEHKEDKKGNTRIVINTGSISRCKEADEVPELEQGCHAISFEDVTLEQLVAMRVRPSNLEQMKKAKNFEGSNMEEVLAEYEALSDEEKYGSSKSDKKAKSKDAKKKKSEKASEKKAAKGKASKKKAGSKAKSKVKASKKEEHFDDFHEDIPF